MCFADLPAHVYVLAVLDAGSGVAVADLPGCVNTEVVVEVASKRRGSKGLDSHTVVQGLESVDVVEIVIHFLSPLLIFYFCCGVVARAGLVIRSWWCNHHNQGGTCHNACREDQSAGGMGRGIFLGSCSRRNGTLLCSSKMRSFLFPPLCTWYCFITVILHSIYSISMYCQMVRCN